MHRVSSVSTSRIVKRQLADIARTMGTKTSKEVESEDAVWVDVEVEAADELVKEAEGFKLHLSPRGSTGYLSVSRNHGRFVAQAFSDGKRINIGRYETAVEAAVAYARHTLSVGGTGPEEEEEMVDGYTLLRSRNSSTGYVGVQPQGGRFVARVERSGARINLGSYGTAEEAAVAHAKYLEQFGD